jgi:membrane carboxypeptidase/penicillin-binding protein
MLLFYVEFRLSDVDLIGGSVITQQIAERFFTI